MTWWQILLDSPAQIGIIAAVVVVIVMIPLFSLGWITRGWWISKRPDGPIITEIRRLQHKVNELGQENFNLAESNRAIKLYSRRVADHFMELSEDND